MASKYTNHILSPKWYTNVAFRPQVEAETVPKLVQGLPSSTHRGPKWSRMQPWVVIFPSLAAHLARLGSSISHGCFRRCIFNLKRLSGTCNNDDSDGEWRRKCTNHMSPTKFCKNKARGPQVETKTVAKVVLGFPSSPHRAPKFSQMRLG